VISTETKTGVFPFYAEDMLWIIEDGIKESGLKCIPTEQMKEIAQARQENGQCVTGWVNGQIVGCGGIDLMWPGVGEVWMLLSYEVDRYPVRAYEVIRDGLGKLIDDNNLQRCQGWCRKGFAKAHTLFRHLGFKPEGYAKKYTPDGVDCILYAKVR
jgi:hypothetical protein